MKKIQFQLPNLFVCVLISLLFNNPAYSQQEQLTLQSIKNFHAVSAQLASAGSLTLQEYQPIKDYGFKHVINLIPGMQLKERKHVESLAMSYAQIPVDWQNPTLQDFHQFVALMKSYDQDKVFVHCELNWRASTFVYLYRVTQLGITAEVAQTDLLKVWKPHDGWNEFIELVISSYQ